MLGVQDFVNVWMSHLLSILTRTPTEFAIRGAGFGFAFRANRAKSNGGGILVFKIRALVTKRLAALDLTHLCSDFLTFIFRPLQRFNIHTNATLPVAKFLPEFLENRFSLFHSSTFQNSHECALAALRSLPCNHRVFPLRLAWQRQTFRHDKHCGCNSQHPACQPRQYPRSSFLNRTQVCFCKGKSC